MNEENVQIIQKDGRPEYAVIPIEDYRRMVASLEDLADIEAIDQALREDRSGDSIPGEIVSAIINGILPLRAWRLYRKLTLASLAERAGISSSYLSQIENGKKPGTPDIYRRLAAVLGVESDDLCIQTGDET